MRTTRESVGRTLPFLLAGLLALAGSAPVGAQRARKVKKAELEKVMEEIRTRKSEMERLRKEEGSLQKDLTLLKDKREGALTRLSSLRGELRAADRRITDLEEKRASLSGALDGWRGRLGLDIARWHHMRALDSPFHGLDSLWREELVRNAIGTETLFLQGLEGAWHRTGRAHEDVAKRRSLLESRSEEQSREAGKRSAEMDERRAALETAKGRREETLAAMRRLEESADALNRLLAALDKKAKKSSRAALASAPMPAHSLPWPVEGRPVEFFGKQRVSGLDTWVIRQGIRIETAAGAAVRPVRSGTVLYAGPFRSYGQMAIVDHGGGFFSVYGSLDSVSKSKGDRVEPGDVLGRAARAPDGGHGALYFEVRRDGQAIDPIAWLQKK